MRPDRWLTVAGLGTWFVSALPTLARIAGGGLGSVASIVFLVAFTVFGVAFGLICLQRQGPWRKHGVRRAFIVLQSAAGLTMVGAADDTLPAATLVVVASQLDELSRRAAIGWLVAQTMGLIGIGLYVVPVVYAFTIGGAFGGFQVFALTMSRLAASERHAREQLSRANAELHATRALLAETSRVAERLRIARDLHDTLGHHLTALSLQLDVASRLADSKTVGHVTQAHAIARLLLGDVRDVVSRLREGGRLDLAQALRTLAEGTSDLTIHLDVPDEIAVEDDRAHALLRCVQEIITNATRHSGARNLWITLRSQKDGTTLHARDDGRGTETLLRGHGLTGMRERFEEHDGRVDFTTALGRGFEVHGFMPKSQGAT